MGGYGDAGREQQSWRCIICGAVLCGCGMVIANKYE